MKGRVSSMIEMEWFTREIDGEHTCSAESGGRVANTSGNRILHGKGNFFNGQWLVGRNMLYVNARFCPYCGVWLDGELEEKGLGGEK